MSTPASFDPRQLRNVLGTFVTGVTVVTTRDAAGAAHGVTANSFSSVSLDPPLVLWSQSLSSKSYPAFHDSDRFVVNILADDQVAISNHFAKSKEDKFSGIEHATGLGGVPVLSGTAAHFECVKVAEYPGGDHVVYLGRVENFGHSHRRPLAFHGGKYMVAYSHDLGPVSLALGSDSAPVEAVRLATDALPDICEQVGQRTLGLAVWGNHGATAIRWEPSRRPVSDHLRTGLVMSITRSATGRAFAAFLPAEATRAFIDEDLRLFRSAEEDEATQRQRFDAEIAEVRRRGLSRAMNAGPSPLHQVEVNAFSAPLYDAAGRMIMALSLTCEASRLEPDWDGPVPRALKDAAPPAVAAHRRTGGGMTSRRTFTRALALAPLTLASTPGARAQQPGYPAHPIQLIVGYPAGNASDIGARLMALKMGEELKQTIYVDNKAGATGIIAHQSVKNAAPDGYTLLYGSTATLAINPALVRKLPYDPLKDFVPVMLINSSPMFLVTAAQTPVSNFKEMVAYVKARPGQVSYGSSGIGVTQHIAMEMLKKKAGIEMLHVPYKGSSAMVTDLIGGRVQFAFDTSTSILPACAVGPRQADRHQQQRALADAPRGRDAGRAGAAGIRSPDLGRPAGAGGHARRHRRAAQRRGEPRAEIEGGGGALRQGRRHAQRRQPGRVRAVPEAGSRQVGRSGRRVGSAGRLRVPVRGRMAHRPSRRRRFLQLPKRFHLDRSRSGTSQCMCPPPSTSSVCPVMKSAPSEARKSTAPATSRGC